MFTAAKQMNMDSLQGLKGKLSTVKPANSHREQTQAVGLKSLCKSSLLIQLEDIDGERDHRRLFGAAVFVISVCAQSDNIGMSILLRFVSKIVM